VLEKTMLLKDALDKYDFPENAKEVFLASGIRDLFPPQASAVEAGILDGKSLLMSVPTAAGKTLVAELCMLKSILSRGGRALYIAPLKALASEKFNDFKKKYNSLGIEVGLAIGDIDSPSKYLNKYKILVATAEKVDSLLRSKAKWLINTLSVVVLDEIHFINDGSRGPTMEILTARIRQLNSKVQILGLSATVRNAREMADWLGAKLVESKWRPIPLKEGVYYNNRIQFDTGGTKMLLVDEPDDLGKLSLDTLYGKGQVLIFVNSRRSAQAVSTQLAKTINQVLTPEERNHLTTVAKKIIGSPTDATKICRKLAEVITHGIAFHHAGLKPHQRELIEENFKKNFIKVISCTPTLAAGVNLPARRAIIRDVKRFESGIGQAYIPTSEYKQCAGRAGRPQYDDHGEAILIAKSLSETQTLFERYIHAPPEPVISKLDSPSNLRIHILSSVAGGYVNDVASMFEFIKHTFLYHQKQSTDVMEIITEIFEFLHKEGFIEKSGYRFFPTPFGSLTSRLYIDPVTSMTIRDGFAQIKESAKLPTIGLIHLMTCTPDSPVLNVGKNDLSEVESFANHFKDDWVLTPDNFDMFTDFYKYLATLKTTWMLTQWMEEEKEEMICDQFNIGPGDIYRHVESIGWLLYAAGLIAELTRKKSLTFQLEKLRNRLRYGVKDELLELIQLKGVGRVRARNIYNKGIHDLNKLKKMSVEELSHIPTIGKSLADDILSQIDKILKPKASSSVATEDWE
jgi:helicase